MQPDAVGVGYGGLGCEFEHVGRWVDAIEAPVGIEGGESFEFQPATGAQHQDGAIRRFLGQQHGAHAMEAGKAWHLPWRGVAIGVGGIGEGRWLAHGRSRSNVTCIVT